MDFEAAVIALKQSLYNIMKHIFNCCEKYGSSN